MALKRDPEADKHFQAALADERQETGWMPASHDAFRQRVSALLMYELGDLIDSRCADDSGYSYAPEVMEAIREHLGEIGELLETGRTLFNAQGRRARIAELKARSAAADPDLRALLDGLPGRRSV